MALELAGEVGLVEEADRGRDLGDGLAREEAEPGGDGGAAVVDDSDMRGSSQDRDRVDVVHWAHGRTHDPAQALSQLPALALVLAASVALVWVTGAGPRSGRPGPTGPAG